jgi:hypothetical protein
MKTILIILTALFLINNVHAQKEANIWFFGKNTGMNFNNMVSTPTSRWNGAAWVASTNIDVPAVITNSPISTNEGCFSISDSNGSLIFSSDGSTAYDKNGTIMPGGTNLGGHPSATQSGIVIPKPHNPSRYYIVSVTYEVKGPIYYSEVDMTQNNNLGAVISTTQLSSFNAYENIAAIPHSNGQDYWLIHRYQNTYYVWPVTSAGFGTPSTYSTGSSISHPWDFVGETVISKDGTRIIALAYLNQQVLSANFDPNTGIISNQHWSSINYSTYGATFSESGEYVYITASDGNFNSMGSYVSTWNNLRSSNTPTYITHGSYINMKRGPDGMIYAIIKDNRNLYILTNPESGGTERRCVINYFAAGKTPYVGLPTFLSSYLKTNLNVYPLACTQNPREISVEITSGGTSPATTIDWDFGDGTTITGQAITANTTKTYSQVHTYTTTGIKTIIITPYAADGTPKPSQTFQVEVIPCAIKTNRMIRTNLKDQGEP